jgi:hypothetical protein
MLTDPQKYLAENQLDTIRRYVEQRGGHFRTSSRS